jgi:hypothetical protein
MWVRGPICGPGVCLWVRGLYVGQASVRWLGIWSVHESVWLYTWGGVDLSVCRSGPVCW